MEKTANKLQTIVAAFPFYCPRPLLLTVYCVRWIRHLLLWLQQMNVRPFPFMAGPFHHYGANKPWNSYWLTGLPASSLLWNIITQWMLLTTILTQFPAASILQGMYRKQNKKGWILKLTLIYNTIMEIRPNRYFFFFFLTEIRFTSPHSCWSKIRIRPANAQVKTSPSFSATQWQQNSGNPCVRLLGVEEQNSSAGLLLFMQYTLATEMLSYIISIS